MHELRGLEANRPCDRRIAEELVVSHQSGNPQTDAKASCNEVHPKKDNLAARRPEVGSKVNVSSVSAEVITVTIATPFHPPTHPVPPTANKQASKPTHAAPAPTNAVACMHGKMTTGKPTPLQSRALPPLPTDNYR